MPQPYIGSQGNIEYREATGNGTLTSPYIPQFSLGNTTVFASIIGSEGSIDIAGSVTIAGTLPSKTAYLSTTRLSKSANLATYSANDVYGGVFQLQNIGPSGGFIYLNSIDLIFDTDILGGMDAFEIYLYNTRPLSNFGDNAAFSLPTVDRTSVLTPTGIGLNPILARGGGTVVAKVVFNNQLFKLATDSTSLWGYLVTLKAGAISNNMTISAYSRVI